MDDDLCQVSTFMIVNELFFRFYDYVWIKNLIISLLLIVVNLQMSPNISRYLCTSTVPSVVCCPKSVDPPTQLESACFHTYISITPHAAKRTAAPIWPSQKSTTNHDQPFQVMIGFHVWLEDFASHMLICWRFQGWWIVIVMSRVAFRLAGCLARSMVFVERLKGTEPTSTA